MSALTAMKLNEQIVSMRKMVEKARVRLCRRLIRQMKVLQKSKNEKKTRKVQRITEEVNICKKMPRDDVSKFALVNRKALHVLLEKGKISADERILYKMACQDAVLKCVDEFRAKYPNWQHEVPFLLQRLGLQYKSKRDAKKVMQEREETKVEGDASSKAETQDTQDVRTLVKQEIRKAARKEEKFEKKKKKLGQKTKSNEPAEKPAPVFNLPKPELPKPVTKGQAVIKVLRLDGDPSEVFPSTSSRDEEGEDSEVEIIDGGDEDSDAVAGNDGANGNILLVKAKNPRDQRKDLKRKVNERGMESKRLKKPGKAPPEEAISKNLFGAPESEILHPSWIAKKHEREALKKLKASVKPRKIFFDDD